MVSIDIKRAIGWNLFDVTLSGPDIVVTQRFSRGALTILLLRLHETGVIQVKNVEATLSLAYRAKVIETAEAVMREEII